MIPLFKVFMDPGAAEAVAETLYSGQIAEGPRVAEFEARLSRFLGAPALAVNSGTSAIQLACRLAGVRGRYVISSPMTCSATNTAIHNEGGRILWADVGPDGLLDQEHVDRLCRFFDPAAIVTVHWAGYAGDLGSLSDIASHYGAKLIEDAAHALGCHDDEGVPVGQRGDYVCFSFQAIKHLTTGDGGALVCKSGDDYTRGKKLRWFGLERGVDRNVYQDITEVGFKFHMNDIAATIGLCNLRTLDGRLAKTAANVRELCGVMYGDPQWFFDNPMWVLPTNRRVPRSVLEPELKAAGIACSQVHVRNDELTAFSSESTKLDRLYGLMDFADNQLNIPCGWWLTGSELDHMIVTLTEIYR